MVLQRKATIMTARTNKSKFLILLSIAMSLMMSSSNKTVSTEESPPQMKIRYAHKKRQL